MRINWLLLSSESGKVKHQWRGDEEHEIHLMPSDQSASDKVSGLMTGLKTRHSPITFTGYATTIYFYPYALNKTLNAVTIIPVL